MFGALWTWQGVQTAVALFAAFLAIALVLAVRGLKVANA